MPARHPTLPHTGFDLTDPLPTGPTTTVLEASAGTGKTYAIVGLLTRYVAEGIATLDSMLLITFSRAATQELRERARARLVAVEQALREPLSARSSADELVRHLAGGEVADVALRRQRLATALSEFDAATIATTHGFCQRMLDVLGLAGDLEPAAIFVEDPTDLVDEVADDAYLKMFAGTGRPPFRLADARLIARAAASNRGAVVSPHPPEEGTEAAQRVSYALGVRREVERRKRMGRLRDFDDLQGLLRDALTDPVHGAQACERLRAQFSVVLVDEFQDTDPIQWDILRTAFDGACTMVLVGDPKQAIYAFRGAEVYSYLAAVQSADRHQALTVNRRSDESLVRALQHLYGDVALGDPLIVATEVEAHHRTPRLAGAPLRVRYLGSNGVGPKTRGGLPRVNGVRAAILDDVAADITRTLAAGEDLVDGGVARPLRPDDIAVLVRKNEHVAALQARLQELGVPAVAAGGASVFTTAAAIDWLRVLQALENPGRGDRARLAALTPLLQYSARDLVEGGDQLVSQISGQLRGLAATFAASGFAAMFDALATSSGCTRRLLGQSGGERILTDLRHVAELVQRATVTQGLGLAAATRWLAERIADPGLGGTADPARRLATDADAVQLMTVHAGKGLEFPVVYLPFGWDTSVQREPKTFVFHDDEQRRLIDVGGMYAPGARDRVQAAHREAAGEELRLFYVAATRAESRLVLWWAPSTNTPTSPLHRLLFGDVGGARIPDDSTDIPADAEVPGLLERWAAPVSSSVALEPVDPHAPPPPRWQPPPSPVPTLELAVARRRIDPTWRRTSYSALIAGAAHGPADATREIESEPETPDRADEPIAEPVDSPVAPSADAPASLMNGLSGGAVFGNLVHEILEHVDTGAADLVDEVRARCREAAQFATTADDPDDLAAALVAVLRTPLGTGELAHITLADIDPRDRLAELDFELPLAGSDPNRTSETAATLATIADLLDAHLADTDPLAPYADRLRAVPGEAFRGYLTGSIDSVLRVRGPRVDRYCIVDYKTNRLARGDLTTADYTPAAMAQEMIASHYVLQALLYSAALHRFLAWKVRDYQPDVHLGPVQYHFVRAMIGPQTPPGCGVFEWQPPPELVVAVSAALDRSSR